ncbi:MAG: 50S ribosomal protein L25 [Chloroflexi bacterium]|nr:50S ribosomal protein L25 [Chloroflexota bacterium]
MTTQAIKLALDPRDILGKKVKQLRKTGTIPVHLYGPGLESRPLQCDQSLLIRALSQAGGTTPISITVPGESGEQLTFAREIQWDPVRGNILHVDFLAVQANQPVSAQVPISLVGDSPGAREAGGTVVQQLREVTVEALPLEIPSTIEVDVSRLTDPNGTIRAGELELGANVTLVTDSEEVVARIEVLRVVEEGVEEGVSPGTGEPAAPETSEEDSSE